MKSAHMLQFPSKTISTDCVGMVEGLATKSDGQDWEKTVICSFPNSSFRFLVHHTNLLHAQSVHTARDFSLRYQDVESAVEKELKVLLHEVSKLNTDFTKTGTPLSNSSTSQSLELYFTTGTVVDH